MISINDLISIQDDGNKTTFITYLNGRNKRHDARNIQLYKAFLEGNDGGILNEIGRNAFNALKKRLTDQLIEFLAREFLLHELSTENQVIKEIVVSRNLFRKGHFDTGFMLLRRAEKKAIELDHYSMLNEIYHTMIEYSHKVSKINQEELFNKLQKNNMQFIAKEQLSILYAGMQRQFTTESFKALPYSFHEAYDQNCKLFGIDPGLSQNFRSLNQLCVLADLFGSQTRNYHQLDLFFEGMISELQGSEKDTEKMLGYHIELLYGMSNIYFRKKDAKKSTFYLDQMKSEMERFNGKYMNQWIARYTNLLALNLNFTMAYYEAIKLMVGILDDDDLRETDRTLLNLTLCMIYMQQEDIVQAKRIINSFNRTDSWYLKHMGNEWLFNLKVIEIIIHFDLGNDLIVESRMLSFQRKYSSHFKSDNANPIWPFFLLVKSILYDQEHLHSAEFNEKVEEIIPWKGESEDIFNMCIYGWLKAKMIRKPVYETTLGILNFAFK